MTNSRQLKSLWLPNKKPQKSNQSQIKLIKCMAKLRNNQKFTNKKKIQRKTRQQQEANGQAIQSVSN